MKQKITSVTILIIAMSGCASFQPDKMYDGDHQLSDTTVFSSADDRSSICPLGSTVQKVDARQTSRSIYPTWVRVIPGSHSFVIDCITSSHLSYNTVNANFSELSVMVEDMKPRHIYVARYHYQAGRISATVDDLGENSGYLLKLRHQEVRAEF